MKNGILISALALALAGSAFAAEGKEASGITLRAGVAYPTDKDTRDLIRDYWFAFGLDYKLKNMSYMTGGNSMSVGISADWLQASKNFGSVKLEGRAIPVYATLTSASKGGVYYGVGLGAAFNKVSFGGSSSNETKLAYMGMIGYEMTGSPTVLELRYHGNGRKELNALGLYIGFKF